MPLYDHFRPPLENRKSWEGFHAQWAGVMVAALNRKLPLEYEAEPSIHWGAQIEIDVGTFENESLDGSHEALAASNGHGLATAAWAPPVPTLVFQADVPAQDVYEVRVYDSKRARRLVAAVEIVSPANKDRLDHRKAFIAKCAALLQQQVSVCIIDLVTVRRFNLYVELMQFLGESESDALLGASEIYASSCRSTKKSGIWNMETWMYPLTLGMPLPTLPLWLADNFVLPLELEETYQETCEVLRIHG